MSAWVISVFSAALICTVAEIIIPENKQKLINIILGIFFLAVFLSPLKEFNFHFKAENFLGKADRADISSFWDLTQQQCTRMCEDKIKNLIAETTECIALKKEDIKVNINKDENGVIKVESAVIQLDKRLYSMRNRIKKEISGVTGIEVYFEMKDEVNEFVSQ